MTIRAVRAPRWNGGTSNDKKYFSEKSTEKVLTTVKNYTKENSHQKCFTVNTLMKEKKICFVPICIGIDIFFFIKSCFIYDFLLSLHHLSHRWCAERHIWKTPLIVVMGGVEDTKYRKGVYLALCSLTLRKRRKLWNYCQET